MILTGCSGSLTGFKASKTSAVVAKDTTSMAIRHLGLKNLCDSLPIRRSQNTYQPNRSEKSVSDESNQQILNHEGRSNVTREEV